MPGLGCGLAHLGQSLGGPLVTGLRGSLGPPPPISFLSCGDPSLTQAGKNNFLQIVKR